MILHTLNKSPFRDHNLNDCLQRVGPGDSLILLDDGVYALKSVELQAAPCKALGLRLYAIEEDLQARGLSTSLPAHVDLIDYRGFVQLCTEYKLIQSWF